MSALYPHSPSELALAPVLIHIENNLQALRSSADLALALALDLNDIEGRYRAPADRARRVLAAATRNVNLHGLTVVTTDDLHGLAVVHDDYRVSVMLGRRLVDYVEHGVAVGAQPVSG